MTRVRPVDTLVRSNRARNSRSHPRTALRGPDDRPITARRTRRAAAPSMRARLGRYAVAVTLGAAIVAAASLRVREVHVEDLVLADREHVRAVLGPVLESRLFGLDVGSVCAALESDPWIVRAEIVRRLPGRVVVDLDEAQPMFRLPREGGAVGTVDRTGRMLPPREGLVLSSLPLLEDLRLDRGKAHLRDGERLAELLRAIEGTRWPLDRSLASVRLNGPRGVELQTSDGVRIVVGEHELGRRLRSLGAALERWRPEPGDTIDLRFERQVVHVPARPGRAVGEG